jgi:hypothetical protein
MGKKCLQSGLVGFGIENRPHGDLEARDGAPPSLSLLYSTTPAASTGCAEVVLAQLDPAVAAEDPGSQVGVALVEHRRILRACLIALGWLTFLRDDRRGQSVALQELRLKAESAGFGYGIPVSDHQKDEGVVALNHLLADPFFQRPNVLRTQLAEFVKNCETARAII